MHKFSVSDFLQILFEEDPYNGYSQHKKFLLYETYLRIYRKIKSLNYSSQRLLYLVIEELRLLFDAPAIKVHLFDTDISEINILKEKQEEDIIEKHFKSEMLRIKCLNSGDITIPEKGNPIRKIGEKIKNNNLTELDSVFLVPIYNNEKIIGTIEVYYVSSNDETSKAVSILLGNLSNNHDDCKGLLTLLHDIFKLGTINDEKKINTTIEFTGQNALRSKINFKYEARGLNSEKFCTLYKNFFKPIDAVFSNLKNKLERQLKDIEPYSLIFSLRFPEEDYITFFLTHDQVEDFIKNEELEIEDLTFFWNFKYPMEKALSGYVLKTGYSDYTVDFDNDPRWTKWKKEGSNEEIKEKEKQLELVQKIFKSEQQEHAFIIPIYKIKSERFDNEVMVMLSITSKKPINTMMRKQIFDLVWEAGVAVELSLIVQGISEEKIDLEKLAIVGRIGAAVGHEIRQPLNTISTETMLIEDILEDFSQHVDIADAQKHILTISEKIGEASKIAGQIIEAAKFSTKTYKLDKSEFDMNDLIEEVVSEADFCRETTIKLRLSPNLPKIIVDKVRMKQVIRNLLQNGAEAISDNQEAYVEISTLSQKNIVEIKIVDNGCGISPDLLQKVFTPWFTKKPRGTGLGLFITKEILNAHDASITIQSCLGEGTTVHVKIPSEKSDL